MSENPYDSLPTGTPTPLADEAQQALVGMGVWQRLMSVVTGLGAAGLCCGGGSILTMGSSASGAFGGASTAAMAGIGLFYLLGAGLYVAPTVFLWRSASAIAALKTSGAAEHATASLVAQRSFWRFVGILTVVMLSSYALLVVGMIVVGIIGAASR